ncbi:hypothetical protein APR41_08550 [Salegentibacter salinarum]|uniref:GP-PDE domain-containing protein n=1 Tax=Salegentibacter salinarum TaxID=447422 RepID=A0A2N0TNR4_9FLAO|nr:glycerophosphodiester phosphodiesterase family protein [Salegentibacter salinarum]PKD16389.1 hypothetical protein APR41_08550 [Salegentibacter salinarum]SKB63489.1 glycerophosphoryl diester phosphodiesterase [Salegentibacter salinarum]
MKKSIFYLWTFCIAIFCITGCKVKQDSSISPPETAIKSFPKFLNEGHRGASGLMPENTIPAMIKAIEEGANVIEVDVHISKDNQVVVTHDPQINRSISLLPNGEELEEGDTKKQFVYQMKYSEIRKFDVGTRFYSKFPDQESKKAYIPLLSELIDSVEQFTADYNYPQVIYNIEIKATPGKDGIYQPAPSEFVDLVMEVVRKKDLGNNRYYLQSFDIKLLQQIKRQYPNVITGFLTGSKEFSLEKNINLLGFTPQIYSPNFSLAKIELIEKSHRLGMKFVPWTVNSKADMERLIEMGVDGIITDYPDRLNQLINLNK